MYAPMLYNLAVISHENNLEIIQDIAFIFTHPGVFQETPYRIQKLARTSGYLVCDGATRGTIQFRAPGGVTKSNNKERRRS